MDVTHQITCVHLYINSNIINKKHIIKYYHNINDYHRDIEMRMIMIEFKLIDDQINK